MSVNIMTLARLIHENNRVIQVANGEEVGPDWINAPQEDIDGTVKGIQLAAQGATPEMLHNSWMKDKEAAGWHYGVFKSAEDLTHPCMVPYNDLPVMQRLKDVIFFNTVRQFMELNLLILDGRQKLVR